MVFWAYLLRCKDGSYYTGHTDQLDARIGAHQSGAYEGYTKTRRPVTLVWAQDFPTRLEALEAERRIKGWSRAKKEALIASDWQSLRDLARNRQAAPRPSTGSGRTGEGGDVAESPTVRAELVEAQVTASAAPVPNPPGSVRAEPVEATVSASATPMQNTSTPVRAEPVEARFAIMAAPIDISDLMS